MKNNNFKKRYFRTIKEYFAQIKKSTSYAKKAKNMDEKDKISPDFAEKIMLAVTGVNDCVYCSYRHAKTALERGVTLNEVQDILRKEFGNFSEKEKIALLYAQHWTEKACNPDMDARKRMIEYYGEKKTEYIEFYLHIVYMGNIIANTAEAYRKKAVPSAGKINFFFLYLLCAPVAFFIKRGTKSIRKIIKD